MRPDARLTFVLALAAAAAAPAAAQPAKLIPGVVMGKDWRFLHENELRQVFIHVSPAAPGARPTAYLRYEERANRGDKVEPMWSARSQFEFDCRAGTFRTLNTLFYAGRNLSKPYPPPNPPARNWVRPEPGSHAAAAFKAACG